MVMQASTRVTRGKETKADEKEDDAAPAPKKGGRGGRASRRK